MLSNLKGYQPEVIQFVLEESVKEKFPIELDFKTIEGKELKGADDVIKFIGENFVATFPENESVERHLDDFEISNIREEYCILQEEEVPKRKQSLEETLEQIKMMKKAAEQAYDSILMEVANYAAQVKQGTKEMRLKSTETFCIALAGHYLIYTYCKSKGVFVLAKAFKLPGGQKELWAQEDKNRQSMMDFFGLEFPEPKKPEEQKAEDVEEEDNDDDLPFADEGDE